jgi:hypothetical protein
MRGCEVKGTSDPNNRGNKLYRDSFMTVLPEPRTRTRDVLNGGQPGSHVFVNSPRYC